MKTLCSCRGLTGRSSSSGSGSFLWIGPLKTLCYCIGLTGLSSSSDSESFCWLVLFSMLDWFKGFNWVEPETISRIGRSSGLVISGGYSSDYISWLLIGWKDCWHSFISRGRYSVKLLFSTARSFMWNSADWTYSGLSCSCTISGSSGENWCYCWSWFSVSGGESSFKCCSCTSGSVGEN